MGNKYTDWLKIVFISPELALSLILFFIYIKYPYIFVTVSDIINESANSILSVISISPAYIPYKTYNVLHDVVYNENWKHILSDWPHYFLFKNRMIFAFSLSCTGYTIYLSSLLYSKSTTTSTSGFLILIGASLCIIPFITSIFAKIKIKEIIDDIE